MRVPRVALSLATLVLLVGCGGQATPPANPTPAPASTPAPKPATAGKQWATPPAMEIDPAKTYTATIKTSLGDMKVELFAKDAPKTVNNFVFLAKQGFYDGVVFHRIIKGFMIQGGDPTGTGSGGPGYRFPDELPPKRSYTPGIVAMANSGKNTNGSQFFICNGPTCKNLDGKPDYTQFGQVVEGMDVLTKLSNVEVVGESSPKTPPVIKTVVIEVK
jgi:cyclophilin family peptidyl-prolyl cis-trans isomerase